MVIYQLVGSGGGFGGDCGLWYKEQAEGSKEAGR